MGEHLEWSREFDGGGRRWCVRVSATPRHWSLSRTSEDGLKPSLAGLRVKPVEPPVDAETNFQRALEECRQMGWVPRDWTLESCLKDIDETLRPLPVGATFTWHGEQMQRIQDLNPAFMTVETSRTPHKLMSLKTRQVLLVSAGLLRSLGWRSA